MGGRAREEGGRRGGLMHEGWRKGREGVRARGGGGREALVRAEVSGERRRAS